MARKSMAQLNREYAARKAQEAAEREAESARKEAERAEDDYRYAIASAAARSTLVELSFRDDGDSIFVYSDNPIAKHFDARFRAQAGDEVLTRKCMSVNEMRYICDEQIYAAQDAHRAEVAKIELPKDAGAATAAATAFMSRPE